MSRAYLTVPAHGPNSSSLRRDFPTEIGSKGIKDVGQSQSETAPSSIYSTRGKILHPEPYACRAKEKVVPGLEPGLLEIKECQRHIKIQCDSHYTIQPPNLQEAGWPTNSERVYIKKVKGFAKPSMRIARSGQHLLRPHRKCT